MNKFFSILSRILFLYCNLLFLSINGFGQKKIDNQILVRFSSSFYAQNASDAERSYDYHITLLSPDLHIYLYESIEPISAQKVQDINRQDGVLFATYNYEADLRVNPNDPIFSEQWALDFTNIPKVWDVTTGGKTKSGKDIVIGIIDNGIDIDHEELRDNIFKNNLETPGDRIDNDINGYVDDVNGYNTDERNGNNIASSHGTGVAGILAAKGDNSIGIAGVNWKVKILPVHGVNRLDEIISANSYMLRMKRDYIISNGQKGANIMVVNYSGGISNAFANIEPFRSWCDMYELLGVEGILSVGSTTNENVDVAIVGDMPSTCESEYLIVTSNVGRNGLKVHNAGYSDKFIHMAAPGEVLYTTDIKNGYNKSFTGTSGSAPLISGVVALFYSLPCFGLEDLTNKDRVLASRIIKEAIKDGVKKNVGLKQHTKWGGYLDGYASMQILAKYCNGEGIIPSPIGPLNILKTKYENQSFTIEYLTPDNESSYRLLINDIGGKIISNEELDLPKFGAKISSKYVGLLTQGVYFVSIVSSKGITTTKTFVY